MRTARRHVRGQGLGQEPHLDFGGGAELTFEAFAAGRGLHKLTDP